MSSDSIIKKFESAQDRLVLQASDMSLETIASMVEGKSIDVQPQYQRRERWNEVAQSALIESFLLNIPVPPVYLAEEAYGKYSVIDGKQRLTTVTRFMRDKLKLKDLEKYSEVDGKYFSELPDELKNALQIRPYIRVVTLLRQSDPELKYEVFTRLNTGGEELKPQEIRNAAFRGPLNDLLFDLSGNIFFRQQLKIKTDREPAYLQMLDVEYVLRFFTLLSEWENFSGDYKGSMNKFMELNKDPSEQQLKKYKLTFETAIQRCEKLWGGNAFRRYEGTSYRNQFLAGLYDAQMISVALMKDDEFDKVLLNFGAFDKDFKKLFNLLSFDSSVRVATNNKSNVLFRIETVRSVLLQHSK